MRRLSAVSYKDTLLNTPETRVTTLANGLRVATEQVCAASGKALQSLGLPLFPPHRGRATADATQDCHCRFIH